MCEINLDGAELFADGNRGIYVPQHFAESVNRDMLRNVSLDDLAILEAGPDHEWYWETWDSVESNAEMVDEHGVTWTLIQVDGDLWAVPS